MSGQTVIWILGVVLVGCLVWRLSNSLEPPWWRCENGTEFRSGQSKPARCPVCHSTQIELVVEVDEVFQRSPEVKINDDQNT